MREECRGQGRSRRSRVQYLLTNKALYHHLRLCSTPRRAIFLIKHGSNFNKLVSKSVVLCLDTKRCVEANRETQLMRDFSLSRPLFHSATESADTYKGWTRWRQAIAKAMEKTEGAPGTETGGKACKDSSAKTKRKRKGPKNITALKGKWRHTAASLWSELLLWLLLYAMYSCGYSLASRRRNPSLCLTAHHQLQVSESRTRYSVVMTLRELKHWQEFLNVRTAKARSHRRR